VKKKVLIVLAILVCLLGQLVILGLCWDDFAANVVDTDKSTEPKPVVDPVGSCDIYQTTTKPIRYFYVRSGEKPPKHLKLRLIVKNAPAPVAPKGNNN